MQIDLFHATADGTLANPYVASAVGAWALVLSVLAAWAVRRRQFVATLAFVVCVLITLPAQRALARSFYAIPSFELIRIDFLGAPPWSIAPAVACGVGVVVWIYGVAKGR